MPRTVDLARLFSAVANGDLVRARAVADGIADHEDRSGKPGAAASLRNALVTKTGPIGDTHARMVGPDTLTAVEPESLSNIELTKVGREVLGEVIREHRARATLRRHQLEPRDRLLFHGPPGCGKTMTARAIAGELGLPVFVVRLDGLVGSFLGQTATRLHEVFTFAATNECVVVLDELDALGRRRGRSTDVGELDRVVIALMQHLDLVRPAGILIAATNVPEDLDPALIRRFDVAVEFPAPTKAALKRYSSRVARTRGVPLVNGVASSLVEAKSYADAERMIVAEQRRIVLRKG